MSSSQIGKATSALSKFPHTSLHTMDDPALDPIDETIRPDVSDSELSDVDEEAYAGIDTNNIGVEDSDDEGPNVFTLKPARHKAGTGERKKKRDEDTEEKRRRRQERRQDKEMKRKAAESRLDDVPDQPDPNQRPEDPEAARRWDLDHAMDAAIARKPTKRRRKDDEIVRYFVDFANYKELDTPEHEKIKSLKRAMEQAAEDDFDAIKKKQPATHKLAMLPTVEAILAKSALHESILDALLLMTIRRWLEPLPDRSLPAFSIQRTLLTALQKLPVTKEHL